MADGALSQAGSIAWADFWEFTGSQRFHSPGFRFTSGEMPPPKRRSNAMRRFNILDAVLLVAAIAVGLALCRTKLTNFLPPAPRGLLLSDRFRYARDSLLSVAPVLCAFTGGCLILRLRRPRPPARLLADFPGSSAVVALHAP